MTTRPEARDLVGDRRGGDGPRTTPPAPAGRHSPAYERILAKLARDEIVILDGGIGTELCDVAIGADEAFWGTSALLATPSSVGSVHRRYLDAGCDVISTDTWALPTALRGDPEPSRRSDHWLDVARQGIRLARAAVTETRRRDQVAVAFSLNSDIDSAAGPETVSLLCRLFEHEPPDLILVETLALVRESLFGAVQALLDTGAPVWLSFRRCPRGPCGVYGQHWGGPEGDTFGRGIARFEAMGVGALLVNCVPPDHVAGMVTELRRHTRLPLGVYPNLGYLTSTGWRFEREVDGDQYAALARDWRAEGAQIVGGCCGVGPAHIAAARRALAHTKPGTAEHRTASSMPSSSTVLAPWADPAGRSLYPLPLPDISGEPEVVTPPQAALLLWRHLFAAGVGTGQRCLDVSCGRGLAAIQLALNGATRVDAIDPDHTAVPITIANAYRNGVGDVVTATAADLYPWVPDEPYDVVVANVLQQPVHPEALVATHRPLDYWGRGLLDHVIGRLPEMLAAGGVAYVVQLSIIGMARTLELLDGAGCQSRVVDYCFVDLDRAGATTRDHIAEIESLCDAHHLRLGSVAVAVAYLLEIRRRPE